MTIPPSFKTATAVLLTLVTFPGVLMTVEPSVVANADICATANGQRVYASGCADVGGAVDCYAPHPRTTLLYPRTSLRHLHLHRHPSFLMSPPA
jgi:hypothetical protein